MLISDTIKNALIEIGVASPTDDLLAEDAHFALNVLNGIIDEINITGNLITYTEDIQLSASDFVNNVLKKEFVIGKGYDVDIVAPIEIRSIHIVDNSGNSKELYSTTVEKIAHNNSSSNRYDYQFLNDNAIKITINADLSASDSIHILGKLPYVGKNYNGREFLATDDINWSVGLEKYLKLILAIELCPSYGVQPSQITITKMDEIKRNLIVKNTKPSLCGNNYSRRCRR